MNSVFNLASYNFNQMTDDELLTWLHTEGLVNMPPIIRSLACRLENVQDDVAAAREETEEITKKYEKLDKDVIDALNKLDDKLGQLASDLGKISDAILESQGKILLNGELIDDASLDEESPDDQIVVSRRQLDAIRAQIDSIGYAISNLETGDFFPDSPSN